MLKTKNLFEFIATTGLTPNQFGYLLSLKTKVSSGYNITLIDKQALVAKKYLKEDFTLSNAGELILQASDQVLNNKNNKQTIALKDNLDKIKEYQSIFPTAILPSGKRGRSTDSVVLQCFNWFFKEYDYSWETILKASKKYVLEYQLKDYQYMQTSQYFIKKTVSNIVTSTLAEYCNMVEEGDDQITSDYISDVVN